jgi:hypothetical protein
MPKGVPNKRYTPEFKRMVVETMQQEQPNYSETVRRFEANSHRRIQDWERIYLTEGPEGFAIERRGRRSKGRRQKQRNQLFHALFPLISVEYMKKWDRMFSCPILFGAVTAPCGRPGCRKRHPWPC